MNPPKPHTTKIPALHEFLEKKGFMFRPNTLKEKTNTCDWYAYKDSKHKARECETNTGKAIQIVIEPYQYNIHDSVHESVEVIIKGEYNSVWFDLKCYALSPAELVKNYTFIETSLIKAWNSLEK
jgi:hypothetical protein